VDGLMQFFSIGGDPVARSACSVEVCETHESPTRRLSPRDADTRAGY
jgi:hypothetical protein